MRWKIAACIGLVLLVAGIMVALDGTMTAVPLRVGMTGEEVGEALGQQNYATWCGNNKGQGHRLNNGMWYKIGPDWRGNFVSLFVFFDNEDPDSGEVLRVVSWRTETSQNTWWGQCKYVTGLN